LDLIFKAQPTVNHGAKFHGYQPPKLGDSAAKNKLQ